MDMAVCAMKQDEQGERRNMRERKPDEWECQPFGGCVLYLRYYHGHHLCIEYMPVARMMFLTIDGKLQDVDYVHDITSVEALLIRRVDHNIITDRGS